MLAFFIIDWFVIFGRNQQSKINLGCFLSMGVAIDASGKSFGETGKLRTFSSIASIFTL